MTRRKTSADLRAEAQEIRETCARMLVHAKRLDREANAMRDEPKELAVWWFEWVRQVRRAH